MYLMLVFRQSIIHPCKGKSEGLRVTVPVSIGPAGHGGLPFFGLPLQRKLASALLIDISLIPSGSRRLTLYFVLLYWPTKILSVVRTEFPELPETVGDEAVVDIVVAETELDCAETFPAASYAATVYEYDMDGASPNPTPSVK